MYPAGNLLIPSSHGHLEAIYRPGSDQAERAALVLHPHPLHGGTMHNKVVFRTAKALQESGFEVLRFNFRGVGKSTGSFDDQRGETDDARTALDYLLASQTRLREVVIAGFSFGSIIGFRLGCADERVDRMIGIGVPARMGNLDFLGACRKPKVFIHGVEDDIAPLAPLEDFLATLPAESDFRLVRVQGAGHFFDDHAAELMAAVKEGVESKK